MSRRGRVSRTLCRILGHKIRRHRRFLLTGRLERCERCGERVPVHGS